MVGQLTLALTSSPSSSCSTTSSPSVFWSRWRSSSSPKPFLSTGWVQVQIDVLFFRQCFCIGSYLQFNFHYLILDQIAASFVKGNIGAMNADKSWMLMLLCIDLLGRQLLKSFPLCLLYKVMWLFQLDKKLKVVTWGHQNNFKHHYYIYICT